MKLLNYTSKLLREESIPVTFEYFKSDDFNEKLSLMKALFKEQQERGGVALAATQVGWDARLFLIAWPDNLRVIINPNIIKTSETLVKKPEGCLSFPGLSLKVERFKYVSYMYTTPEISDFGMIKEDLYNEFHSRIVQHEIDHLDGKLFVDKVSVIQKLKINRWKNNEKG